MDLALAGFLSLYLFAVSLTLTAQPQISLSEAVAWRAQSTAPGGPVGDILARVSLWSLGPWLRWLVPALPLLWLLARSRGRRWWWLGVAVVASVAGLLGHEEMIRLGIPTGSGGVFGRSLENLVAALVGPFGSFLVFAGLCSYFPLRRLPPIYFPLPAYDRWSAPVRERFAPLVASLGRGVLDLGGRVGDALSPGRLWSVLPRPSSSKEDSAEPVELLIDVAESPLRRRKRSKPIEEEVPEETWDEAEEEDVEDDDGEYEYEEEEYEDEVDDEYEEGEDEDEYEDEEDLADEEIAASGAAGEEFRLSRDPTELLAEQKRKSARRPRGRRGKFALPSMDLLDDVTKEERGFSRDVLQMKARLLMETLAHYNIEGRINEIRPGPVVTTFEFEPAPGVKVSSITSRADDLALAMRATRIRIEAPIPGKAAVGIEIPNPYPQMVTLKEVLTAVPDDPKAAPLSIALGKDTEGSAHVADLADMPHLLVAGATGSGKSVCVNSFICNLLLRNGPDRVRLLMVDPKMLELSVYNGIPHLLHPVITEAREALKAVKWMVAEMTTRYSKLAKHGVRNIKDYNEKILAGKVIDAKTQKKVKEPLPYYVLIIDELADLMMTLGQDLETPIARLAQMARAVGIHLVLATQRPSVNVITGIIKANFPSRIAFRVVSKIDSRTILDTGGAEQLLGKGDMLFLLAGSPQPVRVHGAFLRIEECERIVEHWKKYSGEEEARLELEDASGGMGGNLGEDELLDEARRMVVLSQTGSTSMLQRRLRVGYTRAARLMDMLEEAGVVGPFEGSKAREVYIKKEELEADG